jgi:catalase
MSKLTPTSTDPSLSDSGSPARASSPAASKSSSDFPPPVLPPQTFQERPAVIGTGGETHQQANPGDPVLTTANGMPVADGQNSLKVGPRGPVTLTDFQLREKIFHFDHERIPERVVHARGYGAHGYFETYDSAADLTSADLFARPGERTPAFARFSTVAGNKGSADMVRDVRGFAVKLYTQQGNWDLVGNNIPVFFVQDAGKFPDLAHAVKAAPDREFPQAASAHDNFWDFVSLLPESTHMLMWQMSDRTLPRSFRFMEGFGVHTFRMLNAQGESQYVKFHWKPKQGLQSVMWAEAVRINGADPDFHRRDLWDAISVGDYPEWELSVQVFNEDFADEYPFDILDSTKLIPEELVPLRPLGRLVLNRTVDNFFAETEQVAFCTQNIVPGMDFTNDPLLAGRNFSYLDTQLKRLGSPNFTQLPINAPKCPFGNFEQDGHMAYRVPTGRANYEPNSWSGDAAAPREDPTTGFREFAQEEAGQQRRVRPEKFADHFSQARQFLVSQTVAEQAHMVDAFVFELSKVETPQIRERVLSNLRNAHEEFAQKIADGLGMTALPAASVAAAPLTPVPPSASLSILANPPVNFSGRKVGVLISDGADASTLAALQTSVDAEGAALELVALRIGGVQLNDSTTMAAHKTVAGGPSVLFDAIALIVSEEGAAELALHAAAIDWLRDAHAHCKMIGYTTDGLDLLNSAGVAVDGGYANLDEDTSLYVNLCREGRFWERDTTPATYGFTEPLVDTDSDTTAEAAIATPQPSKKKTAKK